MLFIVLSVSYCVLNVNKYIKNSIKLFSDDGSNNVVIIGASVAGAVALTLMLIGSAFGYIYCKPKGRPLMRNPKRLLVAAPRPLQLKLPVRTFKVKRVYKI